MCPVNPPEASKPPGDASAKTYSCSSLVLSLEGAELVVSTTSGGFSYTIESQHDSEVDTLAAGTVPLNIRGMLLIEGVLSLFRLAGPLRVGKFEARVVDTDVPYYPVVAIRRQVEGGVDKP